MISVARIVRAGRAEMVRKDRVGTSFVISVLVHIIAIAMVASIAKPLVVPQASSLGSATPIEIAIVGAPAVTPAPPQDIPPPVVEPPPTPPPVPFTPKPLTPPPVPLPPPTPAVPPKPVKPIVEMPPLGVSVKSDANADAVPATASPPPGDISVGTTSNASRIGQTQSMRLAQRFPTDVYKRPALREPLVVAYPEDAARSYTEARVAVLLVIDPDGKVVETSLFPDEPQFGPSIQASLRSAHFTPAEVDAKPVAYWTILEFVFTMRRAPTPRSR